MDFPYETPGKTDFGDIDIIYTQNKDINIHNIVTTLFNPQEIVVNAHVLSFAFSFSQQCTSDPVGCQVATKEYYQIDLISSDNLEMSKFYFSYGDIGMILGTILKHYNIKLGEMGLVIDVMDETVKAIYGNDEKITTSNKLHLSSSPK